MSKRIAVVLSGCGVSDGSEIHESVLALLAIDKAGASYQCFAPNKAQTKVVNHLTGEPTSETRSCLEEAARIARGDILPLTDCKVNDFDAVVFPGGFGAALNLCSFAEDAANHSVDNDVENIVKDFIKAKKPSAFLCIAPVIAAKLFAGKGGATLTIGHDKDVASALQSMGAKHQDAKATEIVVDNQHKVVTTPAYMLGQSISEVAVGIDKAIQALLALD